MKRLALGFALLLALGAWALRGTGSDALAPVVEPVVEEPEMAGAVDRGVERMGTEVPRERVALVGQPEVGGEAFEATALELAELDPKGDELFVVIAGTSEPLPGAVVTWLGRDDAIRLHAIFALREGMEVGHSLLDQHGTHVRADVAGRVRLGGWSSQRFVRARGVLGGIHYAGVGELRSGDRQLEVRPERGFEVEVVDTRGRPVDGAEVELFVDQPGREAWGHGAARTQAQGRVFLPVHVNEGQPFGEGRIRLLGLFAKLVEVPVDWRAGMPRKVRLVQPDAGVVRVAVADAFGNPIEDGEVRVSSADGELPGGRSAAVGASGRAELGPVGVGLALRVGYYDRNSTPKVSRSGMVLLSADEGLDVQLRIPAGEPWLAGRLVSASGQPLAATSLTVEELDEGLNSWGESVNAARTVRTDADGRFQLTAPWIQSLGTRLSAQEGAMGDLVRELEAFAELGPGGGIELGDVALELPPVLLSGRVVDAAGSGGLEVRLELAVSVFGSERGSEPKERSWSLTSGPGGRFEFRGLSDAKWMLLSVASEEYVGADSKLVQVGTVDFTLELSRAGHVAFDVPELRELFGRRPSSAFTFSVESVEGESGAQMGNVMLLLPWPLAAGSYRVSFYLGWNEDDPVLVVPAEVEAGRVTDLGDVDLLHDVFVYDLDLNLLGPKKYAAIRAEPLAPSAAEPGALLASKEYQIDLSYKGMTKIRALIFSRVVIDEVQVTRGDQTEVFGVTPGMNHLSFQVR